MTIAATFRALNSEVLSSGEYPLAAATIVKQGDTIVMTATGVKSTDGVLATGPVVGFAKSTVDNSAGAAGAKSVVVDFFRTYSCVKIDVGSAAPPTSANLFQTVYWDSTSRIWTTSTGPVAGRLIKFATNGQVYLAVDP